MIKVSIYENAKGIITGFKTVGHAGYARYGFDIICASVSVLVINTVNSIESLTSDEVEVNTDKESGCIELRILTDISNESVLLLKSLVLGLEEIKKSYGKKYINITKCREVQSNVKNEPSIFRS